MQKMKWYCRWAPSLGALESDALSVWGTPQYNYWFHKYENLIEFGVYDLRDYLALYLHRGRKAILWAGSDITRLKARSVWKRKVLIWLVRDVEHWVENMIEKIALESLEIKISGVCPSFLGDANKFQVSYKPSMKPKVYSSVSQDNFELYQWEAVDTLARRFPDIEFNLYGNKSYWGVHHKNIVVHGRVSKEQMNREIKEMQGALRLVEFEGFSEIVAKSVLWGQWPVSLIDYPHTLKIYRLDNLKKYKKPNIKGRNYYLKTLNNFPWVSH